MSISLGKGSPEGGSTLSVPNVGYIRNQANRLFQQLGNEPDAPVTKKDLREVVKLLVDLAGFVDLDCQNIHCRPRLSHMRS